MCLAFVTYQKVLFLVCSAQNQACPQGRYYELTVVDQQSPHQTEPWWNPMRVIARLRHLLPNQEHPNLQRYMPMETDGLCNIQTGTCCKFFLVPIRKIYNISATRRAYFCLTHSCSEVFLHILFKFL